MMSHRRFGKYFWWRFARIGGFSSRCQTRPKRIQSIYHGTIPIVVSIRHHNARSNVAFSFVLWSMLWLHALDIIFWVAELLLLETFEIFFAFLAAQLYMGMTFWHGLDQGTFWDVDVTPTDPLTRGIYLIPQVFLLFTVNRCILIYHNIISIYRCIDLKTYCRD